jgi:hypothetical protein
LPQRQLAQFQVYLIGLIFFTSLIIFAGLCTSDKAPARPLSQLLTAQQATAAVSQYFPQAERHTFKTNKEIQLKNGDICRLRDFVICETKSDISQLFVGCVSAIV